ANTAEGSFAAADVDAAPRQVAALLVAEHADVMTFYEPRGVTGHPDHIQVHRVGRRAAELAGVRRVYEGTVNRSEIQRFASMAAEVGVEIPEGVDLEHLGLPDEQITTAVDVREHLAAKRASMAAHASQIGETSVFLATPEPYFGEVWGTEWYVRRDWAGPGREDSLFDGLAAA
ncbi:MAG: PIG-L deacetylase family protein, partial [Acidimicrobiales bacterium]